MKNFYKTATNNRNLAKFVWQNNNIEKSSEATTDTKEIMELTKTQALKLVQAVVNVDKTDKFTSSEQFMNKLKSLFIDQELVPIKTLEKELELSLTNLNSTQTINEGITAVQIPVDLELSFTQTIKTTKTTETTNMNEKELSLTEPFTDAYSDFMKKHLTYYLDGNGNLANEGAKLPKGIERVQLTGTERVKNDFKIVAPLITSADELYKLMQASPNFKDSGFTKNDANNLYSYIKNGKSTNGSGEYKLDKTENGIQISSEGKELQKLLAKASSTLKGTLNENGGADGKDGYYTTMARRQFAVDLIKQYKEVNITKTEITDNIDVRKKTSFENLIKDGKTLILQDYSGSMSNSIKYLNSITYNIGRNSNNAQIRIAKIGGGDKEKGFQTGTEIMKEFFEKNKGGRVIITTDERQQKDEFKKFIELAKKHNIDIYFAFFNPKKGNKMKLVKVDPKKETLKLFIKKTNASDNDQAFYDKSLEGIPETILNENKVPPSFNSLIIKISTLNKSLNEPSPHIRIIKNRLAYLLTLSKKLKTSPQKFGLNIEKLADIIQSEKNKPDLTSSSKEIIEKIEGDLNDMSNLNFFPTLASNTNTNNASILN